MVDDETDSVEGPFLSAFNRRVRRLKPDEDVELVVESGQKGGAAWGEDQLGVLCDVVLHSCSPVVR